MARRKSNEQGRQGYQPRSVGGREPRQRFLIVCEGAKTEPNYFQEFKTPKCVVKVDGVGLDPLRLVRDAAARLKWAKREGTRYDQVWCVFDRDDCPPDSFRRAIAQAERQGLWVAYSNSAFELWYLLHFDFHNTALDRNSYATRLTTKLGFEYCKNHPKIYERLKELQPEAIKRAERLLACYDCPDPANDNPSTTVHLLVQELTKHARP